MTKRTKPKPKRKKKSASAPRAAQRTDIPTAAQIAAAMATRNIPIETRVRREVYVKKADIENAEGLVALVGTSWEPICGTIPTYVSSKADHLAIRNHALLYYRAHLDHPYHPGRRPSFDPYSLKHDPSHPSLRDGTYALYLDEMAKAIDEYNAALDEHEKQ